MLEGHYIKGRTVITATLARGRFLKVRYSGILIIAIAYAYITHTHILIYIYIYIRLGSYSLMVILGLTWILGFIYFADGAEALAIIFTIANSFQGVAIFVFHVLLHEKAKQEVLRHLHHTIRNIKVNSYECF